MTPTRREISTAIAGALAVAAGGRSALAQAITKAPPAPASRIKVETVTKGLEHPWGLQFLPDGMMLVTERAGRMRLVSPDGKISPPVSGLPQIWVNGQGGLLDVALAPDFDRRGRIAFSYASAQGLFSTGGTVVATARLVRDGAPARLEDLAVIFRQEPALSGGLHFGCRLVFARDGRLFITLGERGRKEGAQDLSGHLGKVVRLNPDGSIPDDNPYRGQQGKRGEIWSYGHRNIQGAALNPETGKLWTVEHGPRGGDEINIPEKGMNYGWPVIGYGIDYSGAKIHEAEARAGMEQPVYFWRPSIAPSGMAFSTGDRFPGWRGNLLIGALAGQALHRLVLDGDKISAEEILLKDRVGRIRDVRQGPDGAIFLLTDDPAGSLLKLTPAG